MESNQLVSIVISNYNYEQFVAQAINSAITQTYPHVEVIVVDDGSTDNSRNVIGQYGDKITAVFQENGKQAAALNNGLAHSKGDIVIFLDADDYLLPKAVETIVDVWQPRTAKVHYRLEVVDGQQNSMGFSYPQGKEPLASGEVWRKLLAEGTYPGTPMSGNAISREALSHVFPIPDDYKLTADDYLSILIPFYGTVSAIETPLGAYRIHGDNQWALADVSADRFRRFVKHDLQNFDLLVAKAAELKHSVPHDLEQRAIGRIWSRIISLRLDPQEHPVATDTAWGLMRQGIRTLWKYSNFNWKKRVVYTVWFLWVGLLPLPLASLAITWLYAPHLRPKFVAKVAEKMRAMTTSVGLRHKH